MKAFEHSGGDVVPTVSSQGCSDERDGRGTQRGSQDGGDTMPVRQKRRGCKWLLSRIGSALALTLPWRDHPTQNAEIDVKILRRSDRFSSRLLTRPKCRAVTLNVMKHVCHEPMRGVVRRGQPRS